MLNFAERTGCGAVILVWSFLTGRELSKYIINKFILILLILSVLWTSKLNGSCLSSLARDFFRALLNEKYFMCKLCNQATHLTFRLHSTAETHGQPWPASYLPPPPTTTMTDDNMHHTVRLRVEGMMCQKNCGKFRSISRPARVVFMRCASFSQLGPMKER